MFHGVPMLRHFDDDFWAGDFHGCLVGSLNFRGQASGANLGPGWWGQMAKRHTPVKINMSPTKGPFEVEQILSTNIFPGDVLVSSHQEVRLFRK